MFKSYLLLALFALSTVAFVGCDSNEEDYEAVLGRWEALGDPFEPDVFLDISDDEIVVHFFDDEEGTDVACFSRQTLDVLSREGDEWTLQDEFGDTDIVIFRRDGEVLVAEDPSIEDGDIVRFERSTRTTFTPAC